MVFVSKKKSKRKYVRSIRRNKLRVGGEIKYSDSISVGTEFKSKIRPIFKFNLIDNLQIEITIIKHTPSIFKTSMYTLKVRDDTILLRKNITDIVDYIFENDYIYLALSTLLDDLIVQKIEFKHFNELLILLIIKYLQGISSVHINGHHNRLLLRKIYEVVKNTPPVYKWCNIKDDIKFVCGGKKVTENLNTLMTAAKEWIIHNENQ